MPIRSWLMSYNVDEFVRMREITRSVKVALKCLIAVVFVDVDFSVLNFKSWVYSRIHGHVQQHLYCACAQKRLFMNFRCKFRHRRSVRRPRFPITVQNFSDLATFPLILAFFICAKCPSYLYFRFVWPTDLESIPHASTPTSIIPTKFQVDMTIHYRVRAFLSADTSRDLVTLTFDPLTLNSCRALRVTSHDQPCHEVWRLYAYPFLTYEL